MTLAELVEKLKKAAMLDPEKGHIEADAALLKYINDEEVTEIFRRMKRWYS